MLRETDQLSDLFWTEERFKITDNSIACLLKCVSVVMMIEMWEYGGSKQAAWQTGQGVKKVVGAIGAK